ncbi:MAG TPA: AAA family ATPase, partial [Nitrososphaera sp.]|nr:AAA family ATPase [Nitrososphaera sp.]
MNWFDIPTPEQNWLVRGLITSDGHASITGKPKAGKSTMIRELVSCIINDKKFLGREIDIEKSTGKVFYLHLDRKDRPHRVVAELKRLGIGREDAHRLLFRTETDMPKEPADRIPWLVKEVMTGSKTHLIVIDLMWQFMKAKSSNDYNAIIDAINNLQDALNEAHYKGALLVAMHARKAEGAEAFDDILGTTGQRGSFSTNLMCKFYRKDKVYTVQSDQTDRDESLGELEETIVERDADKHLILIRPFEELQREKKKTEREEGVVRLLSYITARGNCTVEDMCSSLSMARKTVLKLLPELKDLTFKTGKG